MSDSQPVGRSGVWQQGSTWDTVDTNPPVRRRDGAGRLVKTCVLCGGSGQVPISGGLHYSVEFCWTCNGTGEVEDA